MKTSIKQYRVKLLVIDDEWQEFTTINEVNEFIKRDTILKNISSINKLITYQNIGSLIIRPFNYLVESYDWEEMNFIPSHFGILENNLCK